MHWKPGGLPMELTKEEKDVVKHLVERTLEEIENKAAVRDATPAFLAADVKYDDMLKDILKKIK